MTRNMNGNTYICCPSCVWEGEVKDAEIDDEYELVCPNCRAYLPVEE